MLILFVVISKTYHRVNNIANPRKRMTRLQRWDNPFQSRAQLERFKRLIVGAGQIFRLGAILTIFIACLGLFGLASFMVRKKIKEVSIRKVLGANRTQLFILLSKTFIFQIIIASIIAVPISWYIMSTWLGYFAYKIDLGVLVYFIAGGMALLIALMTTGYQSIKATTVNPAETLKSE